MQKGTNEKVAVLTLLVAVFLLPVDAAVVGAGLHTPVWTHLVCQFFHANVFHLASNLYALCLMRLTRSSLLPAYLISIAASFASPSPVVGFSSVIYALFGIYMVTDRWGAKFRAFFIIANLPTLFMPSVAFSVHMSAFLAGAIVTYIKLIHHEYRKACLRRR